MITITEVSDDGSFTVYCDTPLEALQFKLWVFRQQFQTSAFPEEETFSQIAD